MFYVTEPAGPLARLIIIFQFKNLGKSSIMILIEESIVEYFIYSNVIIHYYYLICLLMSGIYIYIVVCDIFFSLS